MSFSVDGLSSYYDTVSSNAQSSSRSDKATSALSGLSSDSSEEDLVNAVESFESYMLEQVIKQMKDSVTSDDDLDATIQQLAGEMVSEYGGSLTDQLVDQMKRNYGIEWDRTT